LLLKGKEQDLSKDLEIKRHEQKDIADKLIIKIDESLNIFDKNEIDMKNFKNKIHNSISYILTNLPNKRAFIDDIIKADIFPKCQMK